MKDLEVRIRSEGLEWKRMKERLTQAANFALCSMRLKGYSQCGCSHRSLPARPQSEWPQFSLGDQEKKSAKWGTSELSPWDRPFPLLKLSSGQLLGRYQA
jgi:hypothetical protein